MVVKQWICQLVDMSDAHTCMVVLHTTLLRSTILIGYMAINTRYSRLWDHDLQGITSYYRCAWEWDSPWDRESHGNKTQNWEWELPQWEWELPALPWVFIPKGFMLR